MKFKIGEKVWAKRRGCAGVVTHSFAGVGSVGYDYYFKSSVDKNQWVEKEEDLELLPSPDEVLKEIL